MRPAKEGMMDWNSSSKLNILRNMSKEKQATVKFTGFVFAAVYLSVLIY